MSVRVRRRLPREERRRQILSAARVVFVRQGYAGTRMIEVAEQARVGKGTLYEHFESKEDLFSTLVVETCREALSGLRAAAGAEDVLEGLRRTIGFAVRSAAIEHRDLYRLFYDFWGLAAAHRAQAQKRLREIAGSFREFLADLARRGQEAGRLRADLDPGLFATQLCAAVDGLCMRLVILGEEIAIDPYADQLEAVMIAGIEARPAGIGPTVREEM